MATVFLPLSSPRLQWLLREEMILVCGVPAEPPVALLLESLRRYGADFRVIDQGRLVSDVSLRWHCTSKGIEGRIRITDETIDIREIGSVYHRFLPFVPQAAEEAQKGIQQPRSIVRALLDLFDVIPAKIVNHRRAMMSNNSKPYQSLLIRKAGFLIPETIITNDPGQLERFLRDSESGGSNSLIYKSISSVRSIVSALDDDSRSRLASLQLLPTQFQRRIAGTNIRVHVIGKKVFPTLVRSSAVDYRYASRDKSELHLEECALGYGLDAQCIKLAGALGLDFCGIDLIVNSTEVYCLEVNPSPAYNFYQRATGQPISDALSQYLSSTR